jgi:hypothetical protein
MGHLPTDAEQEALFRDLAELIARRGSAGFLTSPIVIPHPRFLPDPWHGDLASAQILLRRLMLYAGLDLDADLEVYDRDEGLYHADTIAWFAGIEGGRCRFGVGSEQLGDPQVLIAAFCHEIAHAYRHHHGLPKDDRDWEERLTDLTTIYLGFGVLTANVTDRFLKSSYLRGNLAITKTQFTRAGYLPAQSMSFLLALQLVARNLPPSRCKALARQLETNQAEYLAHGVRHLRARRPEVLARLGLPDAGPLAEADLARFTRPLDGSEERVSVLADPDLFAKKNDKPNADRTVFALREGLGWYFFVVAIGVGIVCWTLLMLGGDSMNPLLVPGVGVLLATGALVARERRYFCTDQECGTRIPLDAAVCPGCGGQVGGRIRAKREIFAGEED